MFARSYIHFLRHKSRANQGRAGLVSTYQLQSRSVKFQAKIVLLKIIGEKIGLAMNSSQGSREGAECVLRPNQRTKLSLPVTHDLMNSK